MEGVDFSSLPRNIAIIMDGNGRWAKKYFLNRNAGHKAGADALKRLSEKMNAAGFALLTVYAFSTENWKRPTDEVEGLMNLLRDYIREYADASGKSNMRISVIGDVSSLAADLREDIARLTKTTGGNKGMHICIAINYGGRDEILRAVRKVAELAASRRLSPSDIDEECFNALLDTRGLPDPDLIIRTGGEMRLSNFLLWQSAYAEFYSSPKLWPDFNIDDLYRAVAQFQQRERRFGGI